MSAEAAHRMIVPRRGAPDVMQWTRGDMPDPGPEEARILVEAAGVSAYDVMLRGHRFPGFTALPYTPGEDVVGIVDKVGHAVQTLRPGQRVGGWTFGDGGGYTDVICRPEADLVAVPDGLDPAAAAALIVNYLTASLALHQAAALQPQECVLVQGAGGGLGSALLQLARIAGLETFGCDAAAKHAQIRADGATPLDYRVDDPAARLRALTGAGADGVIDLVGGPRQLFRSYRALKPGGRLVMLGMAGTLRHGTAIILPSLAVIGLLSLWPDGRRIVTGPGMESYPRAHPRWYRTTLSEFFDMAVSGQLTPRIATRIPLPEAARAHAMLERGEVAGKIVLTTDRYEPLPSTPRAT